MRWDLIQWAWILQRACWVWAALTSLRTSLATWWGPKGPKDILQLKLWRNIISHKIKNPRSSKWVCSTASKNSSPGFATLLELQWLNLWSFTNSWSSCNPWTISSLCCSSQPSYPFISFSWALWTLQHLWVFPSEPVPAAEGLKVLSSAQHCPSTPPKIWSFYRLDCWSLQSKLSDKRVPLQTP